MYTFHVISKIYFPFIYSRLCQPVVLYNASTKRYHVSDTGIPKWTASLQYLKIAGVSHLTSTIVQGGPRAHRYKWRCGVLLKKGNWGLLIGVITYNSLLVTTGSHLVWFRWFNKCNTKCKKTGTMYSISYSFSHKVVEVEKYPKWFRIIIVETSHFPLPWLSEEGYSYWQKISGLDWGIDEWNIPMFKNRKELRIFNRGQHTFRPAMVSLPLRV